MPSQSVQPLRIQKSTPSSPSKPNGTGVHRPLSEVSPMERRRNSPSYNQKTKTMAFGSNDSSPFDPSPFNTSISTTASPRLFWQGREPGSTGRGGTDNGPHTGRDESPSPAKRSSIENLRRASRVKNSNMFAREHTNEYDPTTAPNVERPLANGRPLSLQVQGNAFGSRGLDGYRSDAGAKAGSRIPLYSPTKSPDKADRTGGAATSPSKEKSSPSKSSMSAPRRFDAPPSTFDPETGAWSEDESGGERQLPPGRSLHRHAKSVTFDAAPPQVNEYEMRTPDLSSVGTGSREGSYDSAEEDESFDHSGLLDGEESFDASLEDTEKTPVVGPEDWRHTRMTSSPIAGTPPPRDDPSKSSDDHRPLPPLPGLGGFGSSVASLSGLSSPASLRALPSPPPPASVSKSEIQGIGASKMSLDDRLRLMMLQETGSPDRETSPVSGSPSGRNVKDQVQELYQDQPQPLEGDVAGLGEYKLPPRISRESILRKVKDHQQQQDDYEMGYSSPLPGSSPERRTAIDLDPDVPIPSTETVTVREQIETTTVTVKQEREIVEGEVDVYSIPDLYDSPPLGSDEKQSQGGGEDDMESSYSRNSLGDEIQRPRADSVNDDGVATPRQTSPTRVQPKQDDKSGEARMSLPEFSSVLSHEDFEMSLRSYMSPSPPLAQPELKQEATSERKREPLPERKRESTPEYKPEPISKITPPLESVRRPSTPEAQTRATTFSARSSEETDRPGTPDSVIRHSMDGESGEDLSSTPESPTVPEPVATVKAPGGKLKTRPSVTPADIAAMAAVRRQVSGSRSGPPPVPAIPDVPPIPYRHRDRPGSSDTGGRDDERGFSSSMMSEASLEGSLLDLQVGGEDDDLSFGLHKEFDRLMEAKKRGYLMRQNTKVIIASSDAPASDPVESKQTAVRGTRSAGNSPVKQSHDRSQPMWSVEPWNGRTRQKSVKDRAGSPRKKPAGDVVPPLPGQASNVTGGCGTIAEEELVIQEAKDGVERGRLFVKVVGVKDLDLPLPKNERSVFNLTLDNGIHCVQTAWLELGRNAPIGQEFELVVLDELEFTLTLQTEEPKPPAPVVPASPTKSAKSGKPSTFSRVFTTPRKRKEMERRQQEEEQRVAAESKRASQLKRLTQTETAWDLLSGLVARDGSFGRSYFSLSEYETLAYGRPYTVNIPLFNEWATEESVLGSSVKSKHGGVQRRAPYQIGSLELQLLFVPKIKGAKDEDTPKSLNACIREMKEAESSITRHWEGTLSQQGGDCPYWRRRFFKLDGSKLTAYHEATHQPRATINLSKASKLIDDRSSLIQKEGTNKSRGRRKSAFAEEEEGYMFVEEGFRIRFANGEVIDFYADSAAEKDGWMKVLAETVGKETSGKPWTRVILAREQASKNSKPTPTEAQPVRRGHRSTASEAPPTPAKEASRHQPANGGMPRHKKSGSTSNTPRSMIF